MTNGQGTYTRMAVIKSGRTIKSNDLMAEEKIATNDYGEEISKKELQELAVRIRKLSEEKIDQLWFRVGLIYRDSDKDESQDAIDNHRINQIKKSEDKACELTKVLFLRTHLSSVRSALNQIEKEIPYPDVDILDKESFTNENGEEISKKELQELAGRIRKLSEEKIDQLWFKIGFIYKDRDDNKAIPTNLIRKIKETARGAEVGTLSLFDESRIESIKKNLEDLE